MCNGGRTLIHTNLLARSGSIAEVWTMTIQVVHFKCEGRDGEGTPHGKLSCRAVSTAGDTQSESRSEGQQMHSHVEECADDG